MRIRKSPAIVVTLSLCIVLLLAGNIPVSPTAPRDQVQGPSDAIATADDARSSELATAACTDDGLPDPTAALQSPAAIKGSAFTQDDLAVLEERCGLSGPGSDGPGRIDGHATGLVPPTEEEYAALVGSAHLCGDELLTPSDALPLKIDHSFEGYFPPVGDQGSLGSCAAWATSYYANGYLQAKDNGWTNAYLGTNSSRLMSPAWVYNKVNGGTDGGSQTWTCAGLIASLGDSDLKHMPYDDTNYLDWGKESAWRVAPMYRLDAHYDLTYGTDTMTIKAWLVQGYVLPMALDADLFDVGLGTGDSVISSSEYDSDTFNHANTIVGYDDTVTADGDAGAFKVVNSWGSSWGSEWGGDGYYWMTYDAVAELVYPIIRVYDLVGYSPTLLATVNQSTAGSRDSSIAVGTDSLDYPDRAASWDAGTSDYPAFMALDVTELQDDAGLARFWLHIGAGTKKATVSRFGLELYGTTYSPGHPEMVQNSSDAPVTAPGYLYITLEEVHTNITAPREGAWYSGRVGLDGNCSATVSRVLLKEDFEGPWNMTWSIQDGNDAGGWDPWGITDHRSASGGRSLWAGGFDGGIVYYENFDQFGMIPGGWDFYEEGPDYNPWFAANSGYHGCAGNDYVAVASSDLGAGTDITEWIYTNHPIDASNFVNLELRAYVEYVPWMGDEFGQLLYATGSTFPTFTAIDTFTTSTLGYKSYDLSVLDGESEVYLACRYHGTDDFYMVVDDVLLVGDKVRYDPGMDSSIMCAIDPSGYDNVTLEYHYWLDCENSYDGLSSLYFASDVRRWIELEYHTGSVKQWTKVTTSVPSNASHIAFLFHSDDSTCYEGAYLDDISITGYTDLDSVDVKVDDGKWTHIGSKAAWSHVWDSRTAADGARTLTVRADYDGMYSHDSIDLLVDNSPPKVLAMWNGNVTTGEGTDIAVMATDLTGVTVVNISYSIDGGPERTAVASLLANDTWGYTVSVPSNATTLAYRFWLEDRMGNGRYSSVASVAVVDNDLPSLGVDSTPSVAFTGDLLGFRINATDNIAVLTIGLEYWYEGDTGHQTASRADDDFDYSIVVRDTLASLHYAFTVVDTSGNAQVGGTFTIPVLDNDRPTVRDDTGHGPATTGDPFSFSVMAADNIQVAAVHLRYWYGAGAAENVTMASGAPTVWTYSLLVPPDSLDALNYGFELVDTSGNWAATAYTQIGVLDNDLPTIVEDRTPGGGTTGDPFTFSVDAVDNIGFREVMVDYWYGNGTDVIAQMSSSDGELWHLGITIEDTPEALHYKFGLMDTSSNYNSSQERTVPIVDNDRPEVLEDATGQLATTGEDHAFTVTVGDNIGVQGVLVIHAFGEGGASSEPMELAAALSDRSARYTLVIAVPEGSVAPLTYHFEVEDLSGNILVAPGRVVTVMDNDRPSMTPVDLPTESYKGLPVTLSIEASDNIGVAGAFVVARFGDASPSNLTMTSSNGYSVTINVPRRPDGDLRFHFAVSDAAGNWASTSEFVVALVNAKPTVVEIPEWTVTEEQAATLDLRPYLDDTNDGVAGLSITTGSANVTAEGLVLTARYEKYAEPHTLSMSVSDGEDSVPFTVRVRVINVNDPPIISSFSPKDGSVYGKGKTITFSVNASDEEGDPLTVTWRAGDLVIGNGTALDYKKLSKGDHVITVEVSDGTDATTDTFSVRVKETRSGMPSIGPGWIALVIAVAALVRYRAMRRDRR